MLEIILKKWVINNGYGKDKLIVNEVKISDFNANPNSYLYCDEDGNWNYDVVYEGAV